MLIEPVPDDLEPMPGGPDLRTGDRLGRYRIVEKLATGGMSEIYLADDPRLGRRVALKVLPQELAEDADRLARFEREARSLAALNHPNIVSVFSVEESDGLHFFTMELVEGQSLDRLVPASGLEMDRLLSIAVALAGALTAAHERGIIHRDLKPANLMITAGGQLKVLDFGLAKTGPRAGEGRSDQPSTDDLTEEGLLLGTVPYMAPEQVQGRLADHRSDIFAFGTILYEIATGHRPFQGETPADLISSILRDSPAPAGEIRGELPLRLDRLIRRCLEKDPRRRHQSILDLRNQLEEIRQEGARPEGRPRSVAVLAFVDMSPARDQDYFCEGIAEELINALSRIGDLRVASRTSSFLFRDSAMDIREIGRRLDVDVVLDGSVRKAGRRLRIRADLVSVADGYELWSETYDRQMEDVFEIQEEIARSIAGALALELSPKERLQIEKASTRDAGAYDFYLRGRKFYYQYRRQGMEFALEMFRQAIELDSDYALALAGMADCHSWLYATAERDPEHLRRALEASDRALSADPESAEAWAARGVALSNARRAEEAQTAFETALQLDPRLFEAHYFYARHCFVAGRLEEATGYYEEASRLRPEDYQPLLLVGQVYDDLGRTEEAESARRRGVRVAEEHLRLHPDDTRALYMGANGLVALGEREKGLKWAGRARLLDPQEPMLLYNLACIFSLAGESRQAIDCLQTSLEHGFSAREWIERDSNLDPLRQEPRFRELMSRFEGGAG